MHRFAEGLDSVYGNLGALGMWAASEKHGENPSVLLTLSGVRHTCDLAEDPFRYDLSEPFFSKSCTSCLFHHRGPEHFNGQKREGS